MITYIKSGRQVQAIKQPQAGKAEDPQAWYITQINYRHIQVHPEYCK